LFLWSLRLFASKRDIVKRNNIGHSVRQRLPYPEEIEAIRAEKEQSGCDVKGVSDRCRHLYGVAAEIEWYGYHRPTMFDTIFTPKTMSGYGHFSSWERRSSWIDRLPHRNGFCSSPGSKGLGGREKSSFSKETHIFEQMLGFISQ
jgi:hypothetical protein